MGDATTEILLTWKDATCYCTNIGLNIEGISQCDPKQSYTFLQALVIYFLEIGLLTNILLFPPY